MLKYQKQPKSRINRFIGHAKGVVCFVIIFAVLILINMLQFMSLVLWPFSYSLFWGANRWLAYFWWGMVVIWFEKIYGLKFVFTGDKTPPRENVMVIANHQGINDIPALMSLAWRKRRLGDLKWFVKDIVKYIPGPGWGMIFLGCIYVKRNWFKDKDHIQQIFEKFRRRKTPIWLVSFLEGTRVTRSKLNKSQNLAKNKGLPVFQHVLLPKTKGFAVSIEALRDHLEAVYDVTIGYPEGIPLAWFIVQGYVKEIHIHIQRFAIDQMPHTESELNSWALERFRVKDELMAYFREHRCFPGPTFPDPF